MFYHISTTGLPRHRVPVFILVWKLGGRPHPIPTLYLACCINTFCGGRGAFGTLFTITNRTPAASMRSSKSLVFSFSSTFCSWRRQEQNHWHLQAPYLGICEEAFSLCRGTFMSLTLLNVLTIKMGTLHRQQKQSHFPESHRQKWRGRVPPHFLVHPGKRSGKQTPVHKQQPKKLRYGSCVSQTRNIGFVYVGTLHVLHGSWC